MMPVEFARKFLIKLKVTARLRPRGGQACRLLTWHLLSVLNCLFGSHRKEKLRGWDSVGEGQGPSG